MKVLSHGPEQTAAVAGALASVLIAGDVVALDGDLGAGKTTFVRSAAQALGVTEPVTSPTFTIVHEYAAPTSVVHVDAYRLDSANAFEAVGSDDFLGVDTIAFVEWASQVADALPADRLEITLTWGEQADDRIISITASGPAWGARRRALADALAATGVAEVH